MLLIERIYPAASEHSKACNDDSCQGRLTERKASSLALILGHFVTSPVTESWSEIEFIEADRGWCSRSLGQRRGLWNTVGGRWSIIAFTLSPSCLHFSSLCPFIPLGMKDTDQIFYSHCILLFTDSACFLVMLFHLKTSTSIRAVDDNQITL